jgi:hypothetical protein
LRSISEVTYAALRQHKAQTVPEICAAMKWDWAPQDVAAVLVNLRKSDKAIYEPRVDAGVTVPMWRKAVPA